MEAKPREIRIYEEEGGSVPFSDWMDSLANQEIYGTIMNYLDRVELGNISNVHSVGGGVSEVVIDVGPGWRVYFGQYDDMVVLLGGGAKRTQNRDIATARERWRAFNARED